MKKIRSHFPRIGPIRFEGVGADHALAFRHYNPDEVIDGQTMSALPTLLDRLLALCLGGSGPTPCLGGHDPTESGKKAPTRSRDQAKVRMDAAFEFFQKIRAPFWCFHEPGHRPGKASHSPPPEPEPGPKWSPIRRPCRRSSPGLNCSGARPTCFPTQGTCVERPPTRDARLSLRMLRPRRVKKALEVTKQLGGENLRLQRGGREGYETSVAQHQPGAGAGTIWRGSCTQELDHAKAIGFKGQFLIEPKPKGTHQASGTTPRCRERDRAFPQDLRGWRSTSKLNIETNHGRLLRGHTFQHEIEQ